MASIPEGEGVNLPASKSPLHGKKVLSTGMKPAQGSTAPLRVFHWRFRCVEKGFTGGYPECAVDEGYLGDRSDGTFESQDRLVKLDNKLVTMQL